MMASWEICLSRMWCMSWTSNGAKSFGSIFRKTACDTRLMTRIRRLKASGILSAFSWSARESGVSGQYREGGIFPRMCLLL